MSFDITNIHGMNSLTLTVLLVSVVKLLESGLRLKKKQLPNN